MIKTVFVYLSILFAVTGCTATKLEFPTGSPYQTPEKINESAIIAFEDAIVEKTYRVKIGGTFDSKVFEVPIFQAFSAEAVGRLGGLFTEGVSLTTLNAVREMREMQETKPAKKNLSLDDLLEEKAPLENEDLLEEKEEDEKSDEDKMREAFRQSTLEYGSEKNNKYLVVFTENYLVMNNYRVEISFVATLFDNRSGNSIFSRRYRSSSRQFETKRDMVRNKRALESSIREALGIPMKALTEDIVEAVH